jgi:hypothetical protein
LVVLQHNYPNAIEYRFPSTNSVQIEANFVNKNIQSRSFASALLKANHIDKGFSHESLDFEINRSLDNAQMCRFLTQIPKISVSEATPRFDWFGRKRSVEQGTSVGPIHCE